MLVSLFKCKKDLYINFSNNTNMIIVTGISGSGKSRTSLELQQQYHYELLSFDHIFGWEYEREPNNFEQQVLNEFFETYPQYKNIDKNIYQKTNICNHFFDFVQEYITKYNTQIIFDGYYFLNQININKFKDQRLLIKRTSLLKSIIQRTKRNHKCIFKEQISLPRKLKKLYGVYLDNYRKSIHWYKIINKFLKELIVLQNNQELIITTK